MGEAPKASMPESEPEAEDSCLEGDGKRRVAAGSPAANVNHDGDMHGRNPGDEQDNDSMEHLHEDEHEILDGEWEEGDIFCGFECQVPIAPDGLEWVPYLMQGRYRLQKIVSCHEEVKMEVS